MGIGEDLKSDVDAVRNLLGSPCTLNGVTALDYCSIHELNPDEVRATFGGDENFDDMNLVWMMIEAPAGSGIKQGDAITVDETARDYTVRRVTKPMAGGVVIAERCYCSGELV
jgi:hypothetical protein